MALPATHIRFALQMANHYPIEKLERYISGTLYPDSRWVTGTDREMTHSDRFLRQDFPNSDFTLGWHVHCLCDHLQSVLYEKRFPELRSMNPDHRWIALSAAKMLQDMIDMRCIDLDKFLPCLDYAENPNGEDIHRVHRFNAIIQHAYAHRNGSGPIDYYNLWIDIGLNPSMAAKLMEVMEKMALNVDQVKMIAETFDQMVKTP